MRLREFYEGVLQFRVGTYLKDGQETIDQSESYVNYQVGSTLICFEADGERLDIGSLVLNTSDWIGLKNRVMERGIQITGGNSHYFKIKDPEGRTLIFEPSRS